ncbi:histidyl-tRNA synthetase/ATP phosphoribosyltransferase, regulatory subunit [Halobacteroides halobius DSM 5150]|uniref:Histidine--tRNA ligase n=1 Tax=Halobacteroides halobius (strain ATCC 35273 / DSM 5150 / MD-1) TaxID=748449 RepID=L0K9B7_HALHC|nr:ATP phosphoribosyltransferase regulatory subunit [Halobacteroides halobius]AGB40949.1 histidyl-tRNA synthetase/ATP phosphoribosyltransferase, regulatory subunit [Halobacteroides halobius DSM 5150]
MTINKLQRPGGTKDFLPDLAAKKEYIEDQLNEVFTKWGYEKIITPTIEYYDLLSEATEGLQTKMYKFFNRKGEIIALRPEMTAPIARLVATELKEEPLPLRLAYQSNVFRYETPRAGRYREFYQAGIELFGVKTPLGDAEVIAIAAQSLEQAGLKNFKIDIGDVDYFTGIMEAANLPNSLQNKVRTALSSRNFVELEELLTASNLTFEQQEAILKGARLRGGPSVLKEAKELIANQASLQALENLKEVYHNLKLLGVASHICIDLGVVRSFDYYTGIVFEGYSQDLGYTICGGGRYDKLVEEFGYPISATGFAIGVDRLLLSLQKQDYQFPDFKAGVLLLVNSENKQEGFALAADLRQSGYQVELELIKREIKEIIEYASTKGLDRILALDDQKLDLEFKRKEILGVKVKEISLRKGE